MTLDSHSRSFHAALLVAAAFLLFLVGVTVVEEVEVATSSGPASPALAHAVPGSEAIPVLRPIRRSSIVPVPLAMGLDPAKVELGRRLFHEARLSRDGSLSCASCHDIESGGDDGRRVSEGVGGKLGELNAPTVLNSVFNFRHFWDGRARSLEEQVDGPLQHPAEMGSDWDTVLAFLAGNSGYRNAFQEIYGRGPAREDVKDAIATFERSLVTPGSPFDRYLLGDDSALSEKQLAGYELFCSLGCVACHQGVNVGGNMFQSMARMKEYFDERGSPASTADLGRFNVTGKERDRYTFKVPALRNIELTAPYFHDGSVATLEEAVQIMASHQLGEDLSPVEVDQLVAFLRSLTGETTSGR